MGGAMGLVAGSGYLLIALGPALTIFISSIAPKPFLILTVLVSALLWLVSFIAVSIVWRAFLPGPSWAFLPMVITAVALQEIVRLLYWRLYLKIEKSMNLLATKLSKPQLHYVDRLEIALASGLGHGAVHAVFFGLSILSLAFGPATYYTQSCKHMPLFLVSALTALAFFLVHTFSMVIAFDGYTYGKRPQQLFVPAMHLGASLLTLVNLLPNGCAAGVPLSFLCAVLTMAYGGKIVWDNVGPESLSYRSLQRIQLGTSS